MDRSPGPPGGCGTTPISNNHKDVLMQDVIWLYNPELMLAAQENHNFNLKNLPKKSNGLTPFI